MADVPKRGEKTSGVGSHMQSYSTAQEKRESGGHVLELEGIQFEGGGLLLIGGRHDLRPFGREERALLFKRQSAQRRRVSPGTDALGFPFLKDHPPGFQDDHLALEIDDEIKGRSLGKKEFLLGQPVLRGSRLVPAPC